MNSLIGMNVVNNVRSIYVQKRKLIIRNASAKNAKKIKYILKWLYSSLTFVPTISNELNESSLVGYIFKAV